MHAAIDTKPQLKVHLSYIAHGDKTNDGLDLNSNELTEKSSTPSDNKSLLH